MKFGMIVLQLNMHQLTTKLDFRYDVILWRWRPWRHFTQKSAAAWWLHTASDGPLCSIRQFLIYSTFILGLLREGLRGSAFRSAGVKSDGLHSHGTDEIW